MTHFEHYEAVETTRAVRPVEGFRPGVSVIYGLSLRPVGRAIPAGTKGETRSGAAPISGPYAHRIVYVLFVRKGREHYVWLPVDAVRRVVDQPRLIG